MHREGLQSRIYVMGSKAFWIEEREWEQFEMVLDIIKRLCHRAVSCSLMKPPPDFRELLHDSGCSMVPELPQGAARRGAQLATCRVCSFLTHSQ